MVARFFPKKLFLETYPQDGKVKTTLVCKWRNKEGWFVNPEEYPWKFGCSDVYERDEEDIANSFNAARSSDVGDSETMTALYDAVCEQKQLTFKDGGAISKGELPATALRVTQIQVVTVRQHLSAPHSQPLIVHFFASHRKSLR